METAGNRLRIIRKHLGMSQKKFGEVLGLHWYQVKNMELGTVKITPAMAKLIHHETGYNTDWLLTGEGEMKKSISIDHDMVIGPDIITEKTGGYVDGEMGTPKERLKTLRKSLGLTQKELAGRLELSFFQYKDLESGRVNISPMLAKLIFYETGFATEWLLKGSGPQKKDREAQDTALIFTLLKITEEIIEYNKIAITPEKKVKSVMFIYQDIKDKNYEYDHDKETIKKQLLKYLELAK